MRTSVLILIIISIFLAGFMVGLYIALLYQNQLQILGQAGVIFGGVSAFNLFYNWTKEVVLKFDGTTSRPISYFRRGNIEGKRYCIVVKRKGVGGAGDCRGEIKVEGIDTDYYMTLWYKEDNPSITITMDEKYLNLFEVIDIDNQKRIRFFPYRRNR